MTSCGGVVSSCRRCGSQITPRHHIHVIDNGAASARRLLSHVTLATSRNKGQRASLSECTPNRNIEQISSIDSFARSAVPRTVGAPNHSTTIAVDLGRVRVVASGLGVGVSLRVDYQSTHEKSLGRLPLSSDCFDRNSNLACSIPLPPHRCSFAVCSSNRSHDTTAHRRRHLRPRCTGP